MSQLETLEDRRSLIEHLGGEPFVYTNPSGAESNIEALWESPYVAQETGFIAVDSTKPAIYPVTEDVADATNAAKIKRVSDEKQYYVISVKPDGTGFTRLELSEDPVQS